jgi:hypothetical protein
MLKVVVAASVLTLSTISVPRAHAGPTMRFGLTGALDDQGAPGKWELGPAVGLGLRGGPFVGEIEWAYLSFFDPDTTGGGVHRLGVSLRADVLRQYGTHCLFRGGCTMAQSLWVEAGAGERIGQWQLDSIHVAPANSMSPEAHVSVGIEINNQIYPMRNGFQLGLRFAVAPRGTDPMSACRGDCTAMPPSPNANNGGYDGSVLLEWMFLVGN